VHGAATLAEVERAIEPERKDKDGKVIRPARTVPVCASHSAMITRNEEEKRIRRRLKMWRGRVRHPRWDQERVAAEITRAETELRALDTAAQAA
jgi:hypothetical protein